MPEAKSSAYPAFMHARRDSLWIVLYLFLVTALLYAAFANWTYDDPFITYRYAANLARGLGFAYNPGEQVLSTTTPLFTLLLAALSLVWHDIPHLAVLIGAASLAMGGLLLGWLARAWQAPAAAWAGLALYPIFPALTATLGSETPLYLALCLAAFLFYAQRRYAWCAALSALAALTRPDGLLVPAVLGTHYLVERLFSRQERQAVPWAALLLFSGLTLPWVIFAWIYFGSPLPVTLAAKQGQGSMAISQSFLQGAFNLALAYGKRWNYWLESALALLGFLSLAGAQRRWLVFPAWTLLYLGGYAVLGVSSYFWYYAPLVPGLVVLAGLGAAFVHRWLNTRLPHPQFASAAVLGLLGLLAAAQAAHLVRLARNPDRREPLYRAVGTWLRQNTPEDSSVGSLEVGILGYYAQRRIIDFAGLIQPSVAQQLSPQATYADAAQYAVERYHPDYLALQDGLFPNLEEGYAAKNCRAVKHFPGQEYGYKLSISVYACSHNTGVAFPLPQARNGLKLDSTRQRPVPHQMIQCAFSRLLSLI